MQDKPWHGGHSIVIRTTKSSAYHQASELSDIARMSKLKHKGCHIMAKDCILDKFKGVQQEEDQNRFPINIELYD